MLGWGKRRVRRVAVNQVPVRVGTRTTGLQPDFLSMVAGDDAVGSYGVDIRSCLGHDSSVSAKGKAVF